MVKFELLVAVVEAFIRLLTELAAPIGSLNVDTLVAEPKFVLTPAHDGATLNANGKFVLERLRNGVGGALTVGGRGGATVGRLITGALGADRKAFNES